MRIADRVAGLPLYVTGGVSAQALEMARAGKPVYDFSLGNPDEKPQPEIGAALIRDLGQPNFHRYQDPIGNMELRVAVAELYRINYGLNLNPSGQVLAWPGSKPLLQQLFLVLVNPGDKVLTPAPSYPIHSIGVQLAGGQSISYQVEPVSNCLMGIEKAFGQHSGIKGIVVNFPHNPTGAVVDLGFYREVVQMAREREMWVISDAAYAMLCYDGKPAPSILQIEGAEGVAVETGTLSKQSSMAGWRVGWAVGNRQVIAALAKLATNVSYGMFRPVQQAAIVALGNPNGSLEKTRRLYHSRAVCLVDGLCERAGWNVPMPKAGMFVWAPLPAGWTNSMKFAMQLLEQAGVAVTPGVGFGPAGQGFVRFALVEPEERIQAACQAIGGFLKKG